MFKIILVVILAISTSISYANNKKKNIYNFNDGFIVGAKEKVDLSRFSTTSIGDGVYSLDVYTNGQWKGRFDIMVKIDSQGVMGICYTKEMLEEYGILPDKLSEELSKKDDYCGSLKSWKDNDLVKDELIESSLRVNITVPQIYENRLQKNYINPKFWDKGITALNLSWMANFWNNHVSSNEVSDDSSAYLGFNGGLSWNGWLVKHIGNLNWQENDGKVKWNSNQTYLQRPIPQFGALAKAGKIFTTGDIFDTIGIRGLSISTDDSMIPDGMRTYAPEIRGIAQSNALVTVKQGGSIIYQSTVPPGPFVFNDISPSGYGSELIVTIKESDGTEQTFSVPYSSINQLLRQGMKRFNLSVGKVDNDIIKHNKPTLYQGTWQQGVNNYLTGYGGITGFDHYQAFLVGAATNTRFGAFSFDVTRSRFNSENSNVSGNSYRIKFNKMLNETNTNIVIAAYRYSTEGYYSVNDALYSIETEKQGNGYKYPGYRQKNGLTFTINQNLPNNWGGIYASGSINKYWGRSGIEKQFQINYNNNYGHLSWSVSAQRIYQSNNSSSSRDDRISLNFSYPLSFGENHTANLSSNTTFNNSNFSNTQIGINGSLDKENNLYYGISSTTETGGYHNVALNGGYRTPWMTLNANYGQGEGYRQSSIGASGTLVAHQKGIVFSPESGNTLALIEAKNAVGATLPGAPGTRIDNNGYAILPYMRPYRVNTIEIDPKGSNDNVVFGSTSTQIVPWEDSVVKVSFDTSTQDNLTIHAIKSDGKPLPFAASIYNKEGKEIGVVGQGSVLFINDATSDSAIVKWSDAECTVYLKEKNIKESLCQ